MKPIVLIGVVLILLGVAGLITGGFAYKTERETVEMGPLQATVHEEKRVSIPPLLAGVVMAAGVGLVVAGRRKSQN